MIGSFLRLLNVCLAGCVLMVASPFFIHAYSYLIIIGLGLALAALAVGALNRRAGVYALAGAGICELGLFVYLFLRKGADGADPPRPSLWILGCLAAATATVYVVVGAIFRGQTRRIEFASVRQAAHLDGLEGARLDWAIFASAALSLFLQLAVIRWQTTVLEFFAFYKNFGLLACFAGLGLGYTLAARPQLPLALVIPILGFQWAFLIAFRHGMPGDLLVLLLSSPISEQLNMGNAGTTAHSLLSHIYLMLALVFWLTALAFVPVGQACGRLMNRADNLRGYGLNLLGSAAGVAAMLALSFLWTPPIIWFAPALALLLAFQTFSMRVLLGGSLAALAALAVLAAPVAPYAAKVYSPYQLLDVHRNDKTGLMEIKAAGHYYQRVHNLSASNANRQASSDLDSVGDYYEFPYRAHGGPNQAVVVVGAGTGNDVAAALRMKAGEVTAVEIDPVIQRLGREGHPERPYHNPKVRVVINDARSFLRTTTGTFDLIVYGLLDSHSLLSHASSVRLDSFVYTVEGLREARARLNEGGLLSLSYAVLSPELGRKIFLMLREAFDGREPVCVRAGYDASVIFLQSEKGGGTLDLKPILADSGFTDVTSEYADTRLEANVSTDDWPFFYMPRRIYPVSYLGILGLIAALSLLLFRNFTDRVAVAPHMPFFLFGTGFMLVETKGITELGLVFGNTWQVIGIVILGILGMAFLANAVVRKWRVTNVAIPFACLLGTLALGYCISLAGGFPSVMWGRIASVIVLTSPLFFSGILFSMLLRSGGNIADIMSANLLGAMLGGLLEYNSMYFGFRFLYVVGALTYGAAWWSAAGGKAGGRNQSLPGSSCPASSPNPPEGPVVDSVLENRPPVSPE